MEEYLMLISSAVLKPNNIIASGAFLDSREHLNTRSQPELPLDNGTSQFLKKRNLQRLIIILVE